MKQLTMILIGVVIGAVQIWNLIFGCYHWEKEYEQQWSLADKASTIPAKKEKISQFVAALESGYASGKFASHDAIFLTTPNNEFASNLTALKTLSQRLDQIQGMNPSSFEYNTAIQQITAQEQGEAKAMLNVLEGCWFLANVPMCWGWIGFFIFGVWGLLIAVGIFWWLLEY